MNDFENRLRGHLADQARHAPDGDALAEQIIASAAANDQANVTPIHKNRQWRTWTFPLTAAAAVAVVALAVIGLSHFGRSDEHPVAEPTSTLPSSSVVTTPHSTATSTHATPSETTTVLSQDPAHLLTHVRVLDLTFVSNDEGWALATADCLDPKSSTPFCTATLHTTNGGTSWRGVPTPPANVPSGSACAAPCIQHIRFATDRIGYAFGPATLFMTTDGGATWTLEPGGADTLETLDGNVIRVSAACLPGCPYRVQIAAIGTTSWRSVALPGAQAGMNSGVSLARTGGSAFMEIYGHVSGGAQNATSVLYTSTDDGATWTRRGEPCPQIGGGSAGSEVDSTAMTSAADGSVTLMCSPRGGNATQFTTTSVDAGKTFRPGGIHALGSAPVSALGAASSSVLLVADGDTFRSTDGGGSFSRLAAHSGSSPGDAAWIGFESSTAGRAISADGSTIWTTQDAGLTWKAHSFA
jgi:photosystem II stability/assembly factor-like uncharacterized protein